MSRAPLALIVAMSRNRCIGKDGKLPWRYPEDLKHFRKTTLGHAVVMGRKTWESLPKPLEGRRNLVVSRNPAFRTEGAEVFASLEAALEAARTTDPLPFVIGGAALYEQALPLATHLYLTRIDELVPGDTFFPAFDESTWKLSEQHPGETQALTFLLLRT